MMKNKRKYHDKDVRVEVNSKVRDKGVAGHAADPLPTTWNKCKKPIVEDHYVGNKRIKREIGHLWKECVKQIQNGEAPEQAAASDLLRQCEEYNMYTGRQWTDEWRKCFKVMSQSLAAASTGNFDQAVLLIDQANQLKKDCHKRFKK